MDYTGTPGNEKDEVKVKLDDAVKAALTTVYKIDVDTALWEQIEGWIRSHVDTADRNMLARNKDRRERWRGTLRGERVRPPIRSDASNLSVPLTMWANAAVKARLRAGTIETNPLITAMPMDSEANDVAKAMVDFFTAEFRNPRGLGGEIAVDKIINEAVPIGTAGLKVYIEPDKVRYQPTYGVAEPVETPVPGRVRWEYIAADDLIYCDGYGTDTQCMPLIGHRFPSTWGNMKYMVEAGYYDKNACEKVRSYYAQTGSDMTSADPNNPAYFRIHELAEIYFDYDVTGDGITTPCVAFYHTQCKKLVGLLYNYAPGAVRPIWLVPFDQNPDPTMPEGQGVCEKLDGAQDETDAIHNLSIEAIKRAIAHLIVLKSNSGAEQELGGGDPIIPGDHVVSDIPDEDIKAIPLGSAQGVEVGMVSEDRTRQYVTRILGLDESAMGDVQSGKRVPASLGLEIKKDSRVIVAHALTTLGRVLTEATYFTFDLWKFRLPTDSLIAAVGRQNAQKVRDVVFSTNEVTLRSQYIITFNATDAAATQESRKQSLLIIGNYLMQFYDKLMTYTQMAAQVPPPMQNAVMMIASKLENSVRALVTTVDEIHNADEVIPEVSMIAAALQAATQPAVGTGGITPQAAQDMGAGIV